MTERERKLRALRRKYRKRSLEFLELRVQEASKKLGQIFKQPDIFDDLFRAHWEIEYEAACAVIAERVAKQK